MCCYDYSGVWTQLSSPPASLWCGMGRFAASLIVALERIPSGDIETLHIRNIGLARSWGSFPCTALWLFGLCSGAMIVGSPLGDFTNVLWRLVLSKTPTRCGFKSSAVLCWRFRGGCVPADVLVRRAVSNVTGHVFRLE